MRQGLVHVLVHQLGLGLVDDLLPLGEHHEVREPLHAQGRLGRGGFVGPDQLLALLLQQFGFLFGLER